MANTLSRKQKFAQLVRATINTTSAAGAVGAIETGKAIVKPESPTKNVNIEGAIRFSAFLNKFSQEDQEFLKRTQDEAFIKFLNERGIGNPEEYLSDREKWLINAAEEDEDEDEKKDHQDHAGHDPKEEEERKKEKRDARIRELEGKVNNGKANESETKELESLRQDQKIDVLEQKVKSGTITDTEKEELNKAKLAKKSVNKTGVKSGKKIWGEGTGFSEPTNKPTITSAKRAMVDNVKNFGKPGQAASRPASSMWGEGTGFSEPTTRPWSLRETVSQRAPSLRSFGGRSQNRAISGVNRIARVAKNARRVAGALSKAAKASRAASALASIITFLVSNPVGWIIDIIFLALLVVFLFLLLFSGKQNTSEAGATTCDTGICYYIDGPDQVNNGEDICYQITLIYEPTKTTTTIDKISVYDNYPYPDTSFADASPTFTHTASANEVVWYLSQNSSTTPTDPLQGGGACNAPPPSVSPSAGQSAYYFKIKLTPSVIDKAVVNTIGIRVL